MNLNSSKSIALFEWINFGIFILLMFVCVYYNTVVKNFPVAISIFTVLSAITLFILRNIKVTTQIKNGELSRYGKKTEFTLLPISFLVIGSLNLILAGFDFYQHHYSVLKILPGLVFIIVAFENRNKYYLVIRKDQLVKNDTESFKLANIETIEIFENLVELKNQKKTLQISFDQLNPGEKEKLLVDFERITTEINS
jgi:hypothetical protein